jgi:hemerythrin-like domain-containing protein
MIKPAPIRRSQALVKFSKDHHFALLLIWKIRQGLHFGIEPQRINNYITSFFQNYLEEHFKEEEELLFVLLNKNNHSRKTAEQDHKVLRQTAEKIKSDPGNESIIQDFVTRLEKHIRFEERDLFNELQNTLSEPQLNSIAEKMEASHPYQKEDNWKDRFWIKSKK